MKESELSTPTKTETKIPKLLPPSQNYSRAKDGTVCREEWLSINEVRISDLWQGLNSYLRDTNTTVLDKCTYVDFSDFVAKYSSHFSEY